MRCRILRIANGGACSSSSAGLGDRCFKENMCLGIPQYGMIDTLTKDQSMSEKYSSPFIIERSFAASRALVYAALTQAGHLGRWMAPAGMEITQCTVDATPGGVFHYAMKARGFAAAPALWGKWTFRELVAPERVVVVAQFSDAAGGITRHPLAAQWPLLTLSTTTLHEIAGGTLMRVQWCALDANAAEEAIFDASHAAMTMGWTATMDGLDAYLQQQK